MPSRAFSGTELGTAHKRLLAAKKEKESDDELDAKIQETREFCLLAHQQSWFYNYVLGGTANLYPFLERSTRRQSKNCKLKLPERPRWAPWGLNSSMGATYSVVLFIFLPMPGKRDCRCGDPTGHWETYVVLDWFIERVPMCFPSSTLRRLRKKSQESYQRLNPKRKCWHQWIAVRRNFQTSFPPSSFRLPAGLHLPGKLPAMQTLRPVQPRRWRS